MYLLLWIAIFFVLFSFAQLADERDKLKHENMRLDRDMTALQRQYVVETRYAYRRLRRKFWVTRSDAKLGMNVVREQAMEALFNEFRENGVFDVEIIDNGHQDSIQLSVSILIAHAQTPSISD